MGYSTNERGVTRIDLAFVGLGSVVLRRIVDYYCCYYSPFWGIFSLFFKLVLWGGGGEQHDIEADFHSCIVWYSKGKQAG